MKRLAIASIFILLFALVIPAQTKSEKPKWNMVKPDKDDHYHSLGYNYDGCNVYVRRGNSGIDLNAFDRSFLGGGMTHIINVEWKNGKPDIQQQWSPHQTHRRSAPSDPDMKPDIFGKKCGAALDQLPASVLKLFGGLYGFPKK